MRVTEGTAAKALPFPIRDMKKAGMTVQSFGGENLKAIAEQCFRILFDTANWEDQSRQAIFSGQVLARSNKASLSATGFPSHASYER
jgi:hypothetical protein